MCGIAGIYAPGLELSSELMLNATQAMLTTIKHRGPDEMQTAATPGTVIGHTRLSLRGGDAGRQPIIHPHTGAMMSYNGELYEDSHKVTSLTGSDTVHVLDGYLNDGVHFFTQINAEFALALVDPRFERLMLVRDRWGTKPLYYVRSGKTVIFCSEAKGIYASGLVKRELDPSHMLTSLLRVDTLSSTPFLDVHSVPPGTIVTFSSEGSTRFDHFGDFGDLIDSVADTCRDTSAVATDAVEALLRQAVQRRMSADSPPGAFVSGGLDSSLVAAMMASTEPDSPTFSIQFADSSYDESRWANRAVDHLKMRNTMIVVGPDDQARHFAEAIFHSEQFVQLTDGVAKLLLARRAAEDARVALVGEGADEIFLGYPSHLRATALDPVFASLAARADRHTTRLGLDDVTTITDDNLISNQARQTRLMELSLSDILGDAAHTQLDVERILARFHLEGGFSPHRSLARAEQIAAVRLTLPEYLFSYLGGKIEMAASLEGRYPFLDLDLVKYVCSLPLTTLLSGGREKGILRDVASRWLPPDLVGRPKHGFSAPILPDMLRETVLSGQLECMRGQQIDDLGFFRSAAVMNLFKTLRQPARFDDETRVARERLAVFVVSVQMMHAMFVKAPTPAAEFGTLP